MNEIFIGKRTGWKFRMAIAYHPEGRNDSQKWTVCLDGIEGESYILNGIAHTSPHASFQRDPLRWVSTGRSLNRVDWDKKTTMAAYNALFDDTAEIMTRITPGMMEYARKNSWRNHYAFALDKVKYAQAEADKIKADALAEGIELE